MYRIDRLPSLTKPLFMKPFRILSGPFGCGPFGCLFLRGQQMSFRCFMWNLGPAGALVGQTSSGWKWRTPESYSRLFWRGGCFFPLHSSRIHTAWRWVIVSLQPNWWHLQGWDVRLSTWGGCEGETVLKPLEFVRMLRKKTPSFEKTWKLLVFTWKGNRRV